MAGDSSTRTANATQRRRTRRRPLPLRILALRADVTAGSLPSAGAVLDTRSPAITAGEDSPPRPRGGRSVWIQTKPLPTRERAQALMARSDSTRRRINDSALKNHILGRALGLDVTRTWAAGQSAGRSSFESTAAP